MNIHEQRIIGKKDIFIGISELQITHDEGDSVMAFAYFLVVL